MNAQQVRQALEARWPNIRFSVRSTGITYSTTGTNGPTDMEIKVILDLLDTERQEGMLYI